MEKFTEKEAKIKFKKIVPHKYFIVHKEVKGEANYVKKLKKLFADWKNEKHPGTVKIDFILEPTETLLKKGWEIGCIGVEIKSSFKMQKNKGRDFGKAICQILDYQSCTYMLPTQKTELSMIFLYPHINTFHTESSIMLQEGLGFVRREEKHQLDFQLVQANHNVPVFTLKEGEIQIKRPCYGKGFGNRS